MKRLPKLLLLLCVVLSLVSFLAVPAAAAEEYITVEEAIPLLRESLANHESERILKVQSTQSDISALGGYMYEQACIHTGEPTMGDYVRYQMQEAAPAARVSYRNGIYYITFTFSPGFMTTAQQEQRLSEKYDEVMANLKLNGKTDYQKAKAIYDYITENVRYDHANKGNGGYMLKYTAYAAMVQGTAVCQGYANLFYRMANDAGLDCRIVTGIGNGDRHAWNIVKIDGAYYLLDSTWDEGVAPQSYRWFLKGTAGFPDHTMDTDFQTGDFAASYPISAANYDPTANCEHDNVVLQNAADPTCTEPGYTGDTVCILCDTVLTAGTEIPAPGHAEVIDAAVNPTCTEDGLSEGRHCTVCSLILVPQEVVPATGHIWDTGTMIFEPAENAPGLLVYYCTQCDESKEEAVPPRAESRCTHDRYVLKNILEATCENEGNTGDAVCIYCGKLLEPGEPVPALGHDWNEGTVVREPTCDQEGETAYSCDRCGATKTEKVPPLSGSLTPVNKPDNVITRSFPVYDPLTGGASQPFSYEIPEDGATMLVFFSHLCGNSQYFLSSLDKSEWISNPYLNVVALESKAGEAGPVMDFISTYTPNSAPLIDYRYTTSTSLTFSYFHTFSTENSLSWPVVVILTGSKEDATIRYGADAVASLKDVYSALRCASPAFAAYEEENSGTGDDPANALVTVQVAGTKDYSEAQEVLKLVNEQRAANGLDPVILDKDLMELAMLRAAETAVYWDHVRPNGDKCSTVMDGKFDTYSYNGENIAAGYVSAAAVMDGWMNSEGHRNNILRSNSTHIGIGCVIVDGTPYWVQLFGKYMDSTTNATTTGQQPWSPKIKTQREHIGASSPKTVNATIAESALGTWTTRFRLVYPNPAFGSMVLIPALGDVVDSNGNVIATLTAAKDGSGDLVLTAQAAGTGTVSLPVYEGQTDPTVLTVTITLAGHTHNHTQTVVPPTCTEKGYTEFVCECGDTYTEKEVDPLGHNWGEGVITKEPTTSDTGIKTYTCTRCSETKEDVLPVLPETQCPHGTTALEGKVDATCTDDGYTGDLICQLCDEILTAGKIIPATGHSWDEGIVTKEPTISDTGIRTYTCTLCGETSEKVLPVLPETPCDHAAATLEDQQDATCTDDGYTGDLVCLICGEILTPGKTISATGHSWDEGTVTKEPTEVADGVMTYTCTACDETKTEAIPALDHVHSHEAVVTAPTCTEKGYTTHTCACGDSYTDTETDALGHDWDAGTVTKEPTQTQQGQRTYRCTRCAETKAEAIAPLGTGAFRRIAGDNRFLTAFAVADAMKETLGVAQFDAIIVASGTNFADALAGSYLSAVKNAPILLSFNEKYNNLAKDYIRENLKPGGTVYILGGPKAVPESMETGLDAFNVKRLAGADRFGTNLAILEEAGYAGKAILVCTGIEYADSLSASAPGLPILLVWRSLTDAQRDFLDTISGSLYVIGGEGAVSQELMDQVAEYGFTERLGGKNRFETSVKIAETFFPNAKQAALAYAWGFPDGLCGGALAAAMDVPLILTMNCYEAQAAEFAAENGITGGVVFGTSELISDESVNAVVGNAAPGHSYESKTVVPTCTAGGYTLHTCTKCGHSYKDNKTAATGHSYETSVVYPTFDQGGYTKHTCTGCGHTKQTDKTEKLNYSLKEVMDIVNQARKKAGVGALSYYYEGQRAADIRAEEVNQSFSTSRPNGETVIDLFQEQGLTRIPISEMIGANYYNGKEVINEWLDMPDYRELLLHPEITGILIGREGNVWVIYTIF